MRYLTKSRFKQALECPTKLFYTKKVLYPSSNKGDAFLQSLAEGGFQVEELARMQFPEGKAILGDDWNYSELAERTKVLLQEENVTIFEAAFLYKNLFIRVDILKKVGDKIQLIEVKAKSVNKDTHQGFFNKNGTVNSGWMLYLYDVAFQQYVIEKSMPSFRVTPYLMLANKDKKATVDGLNQKFKISKTSNLRTGIIKEENLSLGDLGESLIAKLNIEEEINLIKTSNPQDEIRTFEQTIEHFDSHYLNDVKINSLIGKHCKDCEFQCEETKDTKSGFLECWTSQLNISDIQALKQKVYNVSNLRSAKKIMDEGTYFMEDLDESNIDVQVEEDKFTSSQRQWIQIEKEKNKDTTAAVELSGLSDELNSWVYPLNFIDFETSGMALPFTKGRKPYEQLAFQFSHHIVYEDGRVDHATEYLNAKVGEFPNFEFIRALKKALEINNGSIFRYHNHENTIVNAIYMQLLSSDEEDKEELISFIKLISHNTGKSAEKWCGDRDMIDLWKVVKDYYYDPYTKGSNSIKDVLPAVLNSSIFLQNKYQKELKDINLTSKNFVGNQIFLKFKDEKLINPYKLLPPLFDNWTQDEIDNVISGLEGISDGGAALTAYGKLQFEEISERERGEIERALLKYCELDTLAMVMIYESWKDMINE
ncbi:MAG: DUF2779 domain-containing protein [Flavobacteriales bacterium]|nr:DUF2779 domain-containing protein [Flavobacteriales bacterium]